MSLTTKKFKMKRGADVRVFNNEALPELWLVSGGREKPHILVLGSHCFAYIEGKKELKELAKAILKECE